MKMRLADRILLSIITLFLMLLAIGLLMFTLKIIPNILIDKFIFNMQNGESMVISILLSIMLLLISLRLFIASWQRKKPISAVLSSTELGSIGISVTTLDTLAQKTVNTFQEVCEVKSLVIPDPAGTRIQLRIIVLPDVAIPELARNIQNKVKEYVESISGVKVNEVQVYIENLKVNKPVRVE
ncbi:MAG: alkaline shock response membrane anchor protein AmaP [Caldicoprobacterales bacterium]|jgi:hypothetical protein